MRTSSGRWAASITIDGNLKVLGLFDDETDAARAYDTAAAANFGEFAKTNADMGLYEASAPIRDLSGRPERGEVVGEFQSRESRFGLPELQPWERGPLGNPDRADRDPVVGAAIHKRTKKWIYRLQSGRKTPPDAYLGPAPTPAEFDRMKREYTAAREARRALAA